MLHCSVESQSRGARFAVRRLLYFERAIIWSAESRHDVGETKKALLGRLLAAHRGTLHAFFYKRVRHDADARDLAQEVYVRMLRIRDPDKIRDMEAYLFTVAGNLIKEHAAREVRRGVTVDVDDGAIVEELGEPAEFDTQIDTASQVKRLREVLRHLPPRWHAAVVMHYVQGLTYQEIGDRLSVSSRTVKKYLAQALGRCRRRMARLG
jgi:RNA polymerase sigma factor (sigma-70 family)